MIYVGFRTDAAEAAVLDITFCLCVCGSRSLWASLVARMLLGYLEDGLGLLEVFRLREVVDERIVLVDHVAETVGFTLLD